MGEHAFPDDVFPAIVAHRGASATRPENTLSAFDEAVRLGAPIVELDVRMSRDAVPVVMHDATVDRTTDGTGAVHDLSAVELAALNAGTAAVPEPVPSLREALDVLSGRAGVVIEIKNLPGDLAYEPDAESAVEATHRELGRGFDGPVLVVSFNPRSIAASKAIAPRVPTGFLTTEALDPREALSHARDEGHELVLPVVTAVLSAGPSFVEDVHAAGLRLGTWTVDDAAAVRLLVGMGVDAIASNDPANALTALAHAP